MSHGHGRARHGRWKARLVVSLVGLAACTSDFVSDPPALVQIEPRGAWPEVMTAGDVEVLTIAGVHADYGELAPPRATWRSSNESILRVEPVPLRGSADSVTADTLSARRTRILVTAVGSGTATLTVVLDPSSGIDAAERTFTIRVDPLTLQRRRSRTAYGATETDTLEIAVRRRTGDSTTAHRLTWRSSDETVVRIEPVAATSASEYENLLATNRLRVRLVALRDGNVTITAQLEPSATMLEATELVFPVSVEPLRVVRVGTRTSYGIAESDTLRIRVLSINDDSTTAQRVTWRSSNENVVRIESVTPGSAGDPEAILATNRLKVRLVALRSGTATITAQLESTASQPERPELSFDVTVEPLTVQRIAGDGSMSVAETEVYQVDLRTGAGASGPPVYLTWRTIPEGIVRVEALSPTTGDVMVDSLASRGYRVRIVGLATGTATVTATVVPGINVLEALEGSFAVTVGAARIVNDGAMRIDTLSLSDTAEFGVRVLNEAGDTIPGARLTWQSSDDQVLRLEPVPLRGTVLDSLAARRLRMRAVAVRRGIVQLTARLERNGIPLPGSEVIFTTRVVPLTITAVGWRQALAVSDVETLEVDVRDFRGVRRTDKVLRWQSSSAELLALTSIAPNGGPDDALLTRRHRMSAQARAPGVVTLTVGVDATGGMEAGDTTFTVPVRALLLSVASLSDTIAVSQADTITVDLTSAAGGTFDKLRLNWRSSDESRVRVEPLGFVGDALLDSLAVRQLRVRAVGVLRGTVDVIATVEGTNGLTVPEQRVAVTVLPLLIEPLSWPDTLSVADSAALEVHVVDARGRAVDGLSIVWTSSDEASLALTGAGSAARQTAARLIEALRPGTRQAAARMTFSPALASPVSSASRVWAAALRRDSVRITLRVDGVTSAEAAVTSIPIRILERWVDVTAGIENTCALTFDGRPYCWGMQSASLFPIGNSPIVPTRISSAYQDLGVRFQRLAGGPFNACGESAQTAMLWSCWGDQPPGVSPGGTATFQSFAVPLWPGVIAPRFLGVGNVLTCGQALTTVSAISTGNPPGTEYVFCWDKASTFPVAVTVYNAFGALPVPSLFHGNGLLVGAREVVVGGSFSCAAGSLPGAVISSFVSHSVGCWGDNSVGQLGYTYLPAGVTSSAQAVPVENAPTGAHSVAIGESAACALSATGALYCWGSGFGSTATPTHAALSFLQIDGSEILSNRFCGVHLNGSIWCWTSPADLTPWAAGYTATKVATSASHTCFIRHITGALYCWGYNTSGQLGDGTRTDSPAVPRRVIEPAGRP